MGHVRDRWTTPGEKGRRVKNARWGKGMRWQARWVEGAEEQAKAFASKDAAETHLARVGLGVVEKPQQGGLTVREYSSVWLPQQVNYSVNTAKTIEQRFNARVLPSLGDVSLAELTRQDIQQAVVAWTAELAPASVRQNASFLSSMLKTAVADGLISSSPMLGVRLPTRVRARVRPMSEASVALTMAQASPRYRAMVVLAAATGLRGGELRGLTADRVSDGRLEVDRQLLDATADGGPVFGPPKTESSYRTLAMGDEAWSAVQDHLERFGTGPEGLLFHSREHNALGRKTAATEWQRASKGITPHPRGWHDLRHFHASAMIAAGASPVALAARLGHDDPSETLRTYAHLWHDDDAKLLAAANAAMGRILSPDQG